MLNDTEDASVLSQKDDQKDIGASPSSRPPPVDRNVSYIEVAPTMQTQLKDQLSGESPRLGGSSLNVLEFSEFSKKDKPEENGIKSTEFNNLNNSNNQNNNLYKGEYFNSNFN